MTENLQTLPVALWPLNGLLARLRAHFNGVNDSHNARQSHLEVTDRDIADTARSREEIVGFPSYQPELPFFMQRDFQTHCR